MGLPAQLADTGLADYTARAHGYVTFLAQLGDGFPVPPVVIKSDELMVEVYWGAPDRSKQRIIGRRDTLLLPTDINYHRDHLGIVQNNFPAIIRLGDGDEVRDVRHPLSEAGLTSYDYRIADSLMIRTADRTIEVLQVSVRPKDDRLPAAVGAVFIDRVTAGVVRMSFSFTRAALWWGAPTDMPVPGDYDGDGKADPAVFRPSAGAWFILRSRDGAVATSWGGPSDFPLAADYDGDKRVDPTVFRPSYRNWYQILSGTATSRYITFGNAGDLPL